MVEMNQLFSMVNQVPDSIVGQSNPFEKAPYTVNPFMQYTDPMRYGGYDYKKYPYSYTMDDARARAIFDGMYNNTAGQNNGRESIAPVSSIGGGYDNSYSGNVDGRGVDGGQSSGGGWGYNGAADTGVRGNPVGDNFSFGDAAKGFMGGLRGGLLGGVLGGIAGGMRGGQSTGEAMTAADTAMRGAQESFNASERGDAPGSAVGGLAANGLGVGDVGLGGKDSAGISGDGYGGLSSDGNAGDGIGFGGDAYAKGGVVDQLHGEDPIGPDDGQAYLQFGEGVLTVETVKRLGGKKAIDALNSGRAKIVMIG
jgi:hypothetical protein